MQVLHRTLLPAERGERKPGELLPVVSRYYYDRQPRLEEHRLPEPLPKKSSIQQFMELMSASGAAPSAITSFRLHYQRLHEGDRGFLPEEAIRPTEFLADFGDFDDYVDAGRAAMDKATVIKLNGGLGTSMGLDGAKTLLPVRDGLNFLDLIARQMLALRSDVGTKIPLVLMNSFRTAKDSDRVLAGYPNLPVSNLPLSFLQNMVPKVLEDGLAPAEHDRRPELGWCPPGHGDLYTAIKSSGLLEQLIGRGIEYAFVSNADNLGAALDPSLLGYMVAKGLDFMLEAADRTPADRKGGHLCQLLDGRLALRESAQCPPEQADVFQDVSRHRYFNTNNLWVHLTTLNRLLEEHGGFLPLPTVVNRKTLDPRDPASPRVFQLETVMGTAISLFQNTAAVRVPRRRFSPVKNTNDLLGVRSDAYDLSDDGRIVLSAGRSEPPVIRLDDEFFKMIDDFEKRFPKGPPSLRQCDRLTVEGDVTFGSRVAIEGETFVRAIAEATVPDGSILSGRVDLGT
jgi:UTP--glucose-1-phosphate uridylyltransferase